MQWVLGKKYGNLQKDKTIEISSQVDVMKEVPLFFSNEQYNLFGIFHYPENNDRNEGFVFCHAFGEEKLWAHRVYVNFARELSRRGYTVLRFDFMGHGDSDGEFEQSTIRTQESDISCAIETLKSKCSNITKINLLGLRFGATLAAIAAEKNANISKLILWDPIVSGSQYMNQLLRTNLTMQMAIHKKVINNRKQLVQDLMNEETVSIDGYMLSKDHYLQAIEVDLMQEHVSTNEGCLIVDIVKKNRPIPEKLIELSRSIKTSEVDQVVEDEFWKEIKKHYQVAPALYDSTINWLEKGTCNE